MEMFWSRIAAQLTWYFIRLWDCPFNKSNIYRNSLSKWKCSGAASPHTSHPTSYACETVPLINQTCYRNSPTKWKCSRAASPHTSHDILYAIETDPLINKSNIYRKSPSNWKCSGAASPNNSHDTLYACETVPLINQTVLPKLTAEMEMFWSRIAAHLACQTEQNTGGGGRRCLLRRLRWWRHVGHLFGDALAVVAVAVCCVGWVSGGGGDGRGDCWALNKNTCP